MASRIWARCARPPSPFSWAREKALSSLRSILVRVLHRATNSSRTCMASPPPPAMTANKVNTTVLALRRSKAFLLQHLTAYVLLLSPIYATILSMTTLLVWFSRKLLPVAAVRIMLVPLAAAVLFIFSDNVLRATTALMAMDEQARVRKFLSFRVFWKLVRTMPALVV